MLTYANIMKYVRVAKLILAEIQEFYIQKQTAVQR